jgi:2,3,4,5-tetrahydropyridine-2-carboxylate N-succinyltransferase
LGGVLEPASARPVIIEDGAFIGSRCVVVEGVLVETEAVLGANTVLTASTQIIDVTGPRRGRAQGPRAGAQRGHSGHPGQAVPAGEYQVPCALIIGGAARPPTRRPRSTQVLRDFAVPV